MNVLQVANNLGIDLSLDNNFIVITQNTSLCHHAALSVTCKLLSLLNKETLMHLGYTQWYISFEMHPNYPLHELSKAMEKIMEVADEYDFTFDTQTNETLSLGEIYLSIFLYQQKGEKNAKKH
ncbi:MAG: hypothetical protein EOM50_10480 [Erysipelotrichia bacterium]|nr:hypothetical protein [Erysipelotrichia bacterium]